MTDAEWATRLRRSRQALASWQHEATLPWVDNAMMLSIAETEIGALKHYAPYIPVRMRGDVTPLVHDWDEFRLVLVARC